MKTPKKTIRESFSKAAGTYDLHSELQKEVAVWLADRIRSEVGQQLLTHSVDGGRYALSASMDAVDTLIPGRFKILDIGCGTGNLAVLLRGFITGAVIYATDLAMPMLEKTRERLGAKSILIASDCEALPFSGSTFEIIVSSLAYQWAQDPVQAFKEAARALKPGGALFFSTLGPATLGELRYCYGEASPERNYHGTEVYPDTETISAFLRKAGLDLLSMERHIVRKRYANLNSLIRTLKMIGAAPAAKCKTFDSQTDMTLRKAGRIYEQNFPAPEGGISATYEVILVSAKKNR